MPNPIAAAPDLAAVGNLGTLSPAMTTAVDALLDGLVASLELRLGRWIGLRVGVVQTVYADPHTGMIALAGSPLKRITAMVVGTETITLSPIPLAVVSEWRYHHSVAVTVTYDAGIDLAARPDLMGAIRHAVLMKALPYAQALLARQQAVISTATAGQATSVPAPVPGVKNFSVEGLTVGYDSASALAEEATKAAQVMAAAAVWADDDLLALPRLKRVVMA